jgi:molybdate transport system substrate-binding protein
MSTNTPILGISSMATRALLADLAQAGPSGPTVTMQSVGGVDAARRVAEGEVFDLVVLASDAIDRLLTQGHLLAGSRVDLVRSGVAAAWPAGRPAPDLSTQAALRQAVLDAPSVGYSTGPSGTALLGRFDQWGIAEQVKGKLVQAPAGVPVGRMVAAGDVALGFQQLSELMGLNGIAWALLPEEAQIVTIFSGAVAARSTQPEAVRQLLSSWASPETGDIKAKHGMQPA